MYKTKLLGKSVRVNPETSADKTANKTEDYFKEKRYKFYRVTGKEYPLEIVPGVPRRCG